MKSVLLLHSGPRSFSCPRCNYNRKRVCWGSTWGKKSIPFYCRRTGWTTSLARHTSSSSRSCHPEHAVNLRWKQSQRAAGLGIIPDFVMGDMLLSLMCTAAATPEPHLRSPAERKWDKARGGDSASLAWHYKLTAVSAHWCIVPQCVLAWLLLWLLPLSFSPRHTEFHVLTNRNVEQNKSVAPLLHQCKWWMFKTLKNLFCKCFIK